MVEEGKTENLDLQDVRITADVEVPKSLLDKVAGLCVPDEEGDCLFGELYKLDGNNVTLTALVEGVKKGGTKNSITFVCRKTKSKRLSIDFIRTSKLIDILADYDKKVIFDCFIRLQFARRYRAKSIVHLPINITDLNNSPFNEIHGVHFVKKRGKEYEYEVILDLLENGKLQENILFKYNAKIKKGMLNEIYDIAKNISERFV